MTFIVNYCEFLVCLYCNYNKDKKFRNFTLVSIYKFFLFLDKIVSLHDKTMLMIIIVV